MTSSEPPPPPGPQDPQQPYSAPYGQQYDPYSGQPYPTTPPYQPYTEAAPGAPYGGQQPYAPYPTPQPYPYGGYPPAPGYQQYPPPLQDGPKGQAIAALITNIVLTLSCCLPLGVAGIVTSAMAMSRAETQPESARSLLKWSWILAASGLVLGLVFWAYIVFVVRTTPTS